jgi:hypothetical protein
LVAALIVYGTSTYDFVTGRHHTGKTSRNLPTDMAGEDAGPVDAGAVNSHA